MSPCFEPFFALQTLTDDNARIHPGWKRAAVQKIPQSFYKKFSLIGGSPYLWPAVADALLGAPLNLSFENRISRLADLSTKDLQEAIFSGIFHEPAPVRNLLSGRTDLQRAITQVSKSKREWLAFIGLYPVRKTAPLFVGLNCLLRTPGEFQRILVHLLEAFWQIEFKQTWNDLSAQMERSLEEKERLFQSCTFDEFAHLALLRVRLDEKRGVLEAVRGGYKLPLKRLSQVVLLPSAFNDKRHWTTCERDPNKLVAFFPYFDPAISLSRVPSVPPEKVEEPERDPALIFKALGDTTRYAMAALLARDSLTSSHLAKTLSLSRPSVSHHIHVLREAGLLDEKLQGNTVVLSLRRDVIENLSDLATQKLFHSDEKIDLKKTRNK